MFPHRSAAHAARLAVPCGDANRTPHRHPVRPEDPTAHAGAVYEPEELAALDSSQARALIAALAPAQRVAQATTHAAWLNEFGYGVTVAQVLAA
jgi:hypothetical protein